MILRHSSHNIIIIYFPWKIQCPIKSSPPTPTNHFKYVPCQGLTSLPCVTGNSGIMSVLKYTIFSNLGPIREWLFLCASLEKRGQVYFCYLVSLKILKSLLFLILSLINFYYSILMFSHWGFMYKVVERVKSRPL